MPSVIRYEKSRSKRSLLLKRFERNRKSVYSDRIIENSRKYGGLKVPSSKTSGISLTALLIIDSAYCANTVTIIIIIAVIIIMLMI